MTVRSGARSPPGKFMKSFLSETHAHSGRRAAAAVLLLLSGPGAARAWPNRLADPGFETYSYDAGLGYYVLAPQSPWKQVRGPGDIRFDASSWSAPAEMVAERPLGFSPGTTGFQGLNLGQNSGRILLYQDIVNPVLLSGGPWYEAWDWLGGGGFDNDATDERKEENGGWEIFFYANTNNAAWTENNAMERHYCLRDFSGEPNSFERVSGYGKVPVGAVGLRFRALGYTWAPASTPASYGTKVAIDNAHFAIMKSPGGGQLLVNGDFEQDASVAQFYGWQRPSPWPFPYSGFTPFDIGNLYGDGFDHGGFRPFYGGLRTYGYVTYLNDWIRDGFTFTQIVNYASPGTPLTLMCYWGQDAQNFNNYRARQLGKIGASMQMVVEYLTGSTPIGNQTFDLGWPICRNAANMCDFDRNAGSVWNPRFRLLPPGGTDHVRLNVAVNIDLLYDPSRGHMVSVVDDFFLGYEDADAIDNVQVTNLGPTRATITWSTDHLLDSAVDFGPTTSYGQTVSDPAPVSAHSVTLTGLVSGQTYYYRVRSGTAVYPEFSQAGSVFFRTPAMGDFNGDGDVDQEDFGEFQLCMTGVGFEQPLESCFQARLDADNDVDLQDVTLFAGCMSGSNLTPSPTCIPPN